MGGARTYRGDPAGGDPFLADFFRMIPEPVARSFTDEQLRAIKMAFAARERGTHSVDVRFSVPLLRRYVVLLIGRERRSAERRRGDRRAHPLATAGNLFALAVTVFVLAIPVFVIAYGVKSFFDIDLVDGGGVHAGIEALRQQLVALIKSM